MKSFKLLLLFCFAAQIAYAQNDRISALPTATGTGAKCVMAIVQNNIIKKISTDSLLAPAIKYADSLQVKNLAALNGKQATLISGTNIKTVNGNSLLGSGDVVISSSSSPYTLTKNAAQDSIILSNGIVRSAVMSSFQVLDITYSASLNQTDFATPSAITNIKRIQVFRNGVENQITQISSNTVRIPIAADVGDRIKILQLN